MGKFVDVLGLIVFLAAVVGILCVVVWNMPMIGLIVGSVIAALGLGWGLIQIVGAVSGSARAQWNADSSQIGVLSGFAIFGLGIGLTIASTIQARSGRQPQPPGQHAEEDTTETAATSVRQLQR
jgi:MFS family permease